jgi:hypothetical protein
MQTLEQRVERLERSCRRWRMGFLFLLLVSAMGAQKLAMVVQPADAEFAHLTVQSLTVRTPGNGAMLLASCDKDQASLKLISPAAETAIALIAQKDSANLFLSRNTPAGLSSATLSADQRSGFIDVRTAQGKDKEIEPD